MPTQPKRFIQELSLRGHSYKLIVEISVQTGAQWQAVSLKNDEKLFGPKEFGSESEAKNVAHQWAYADAGVNDHFCDGNCHPWRNS